MDCLSNCLEGLTAWLRTTDPAFLLVAMTLLPLAGVPASARNASVQPVRNDGPHGFGRAVIKGIDWARGDAVVVMMADESDDYRDVVRYWHLLEQGWDCVFGSRFVKGGGVIDYPWLKLRINRLANLFIRILFRIPLNDTTDRLLTEYQYQYLS